MPMNGSSVSLQDRENVLVTGGAGYIGSSLVPLLLERGHRVVVFDKFYFGISPLLSVISDPNLTLIKGDICNKEELKSVLTDNITTVIHLAAIVGYPACAQNPQLAVEVNELGTANVVELLKDHQKLILASTGSCYGAIEGVCTEETSICPLTLYGQTKSRCETMVRRKNGICLRLATLFGVSGRMRLDLLINNVVHVLLVERQFELYEPNFRRTFLHVRDAAAAFCFAMVKYEQMKGQVFNVGDESMNMTKEVAIRKIVSLMPFPCRIQTSGTGEDQDKRDYEVSYEKIRNLGFRSNISLEQGIEELIKTIPQMSITEIKSAKNVSV